MSLPASTLEPFADADVDEEEAAGIAMDSRALADAASLLLPELEEPSTSGASGVAEAESAAGAALTSQLALRVLRDAIGLQLARRGFDGLRANPLSLVAEMAAHFIGGLGVQLQLVAPPRTASPARRPDPMVPYVLRLQRHTNLRSVAEWNKLKELFSRKTEAPRPPPASSPARSPQPEPGTRPRHTRSTRWRATRCSSW